MPALTVSLDDEKRAKARGFLNNRGTDNFSARVVTVNGKVTAQQQRVIADAAEKYGNGTITFTSRMCMEIPGIPYEKIDEFCEYIGKAGLAPGGTGPRVRPVVCCKGTTCQFGLLDSFGIAEEIHKRFYEGYHQVTLPHKFKIGVGGCPNNCVKPDLNDLGIVGQRIPGYDPEKCKECKKCALAANCPMGAAKLADGRLAIDETLCNNCGRCVGKCPFGCNDEGTYGYKIYLGGRWGKTAFRGIPLKTFFKEKEEMLAVVEKAILLFKDQGKAGERFSAVVERLGLEQVENMLLSDDLLKRKEEICSR